MMAQDPLTFGIRAVTVRQLCEYAVDGELDGARLGYVQLVGKLYPSPHSTSTTLHFVFCDGTGRVGEVNAVTGKRGRGTAVELNMVRTFVISERFSTEKERVCREKNERLDEEEEEKKLQFPWEQDVYYKVVGYMNFANNHVEVKSVVEITDFNELTHHHLLAIHTHLKLTRDNK